jgi:beta-galactosidase/beta-glucuronidase
MDTKYIKLNENWKFNLNDCPEAFEKDYDSSDWEEVTLPHDWSVKQPFSKENSSGTGYLSGGIGWYRKTFNLPETFRGKKIWIIFDGIYKNSQVWCNSYYKGKWPYGYTTFRYDITDQVCFGDTPNVISVKVDHRDISDSRWFTGSGITRKVQILVEDLVHPTPDGIFFTTPLVTSAEAQISINNEISNDSNSDSTVTIKNILLTPDGIETACFSNTQEILAGETKTISTEGTINSPLLWSPESPTLYTLLTKVNVNPIDTEDKDSSCKTELWNVANSKKVGIRSISFHADKGFFLNGISTTFKGVCLHHDAGCLGAAVLPEIWLRRLMKLKEAGCNAIRMSHNPHMPELYDLCDEVGFLVMDEAFDEWEGAKNKWWQGHNVYPPKHQGYFEEFPEWHERDLKALIKRDRNHPSIVMWSIGNEIDYPNDPYCHPLFSAMTGNNDANKPEAERQYNSSRPNAERLSVLANHLTKLVKEEDTTRPVTAAVAFPELSTQIGFIDSLDVVGYNYKEHLYEQDHARFPEKPFLGSENSHSLEAWNAVLENDYISGQFLWTGIDYLGEAHGWPIHGSYAGFMTLAGFEKTAFYRRQSLWSLEPMIKIVTARSDDDNENEWKTMYESWNYTPGELILVRCYTNLQSAELFCNKKSIGIKNLDKETGYISWILPFEEGLLEVISNHISNNESHEITDKIETTTSSCNIQLSLWKNQASDVALHEDVHQIEVTITDTKNRRVVNDASMLHIEIEGAGELLGLENGDLSDVTEYTANYRKAYEGRLIIYVRKTSKKASITINVYGSNLKSAKLIL